MNILVLTVLWGTLLRAEPVTVDIIDEQVLMCAEQCCVIRDMEAGESEIWLEFEKKCLVKENSVK